MHQQDLNKFFEQILLPLLPSGRHSQVCAASDRTFFSLKRNNARTFQLSCFIEHISQIQSDCSIVFVSMQDLVATIIFSTLLTHFPSACELRPCRNTACHQPSLCAFRHKCTPQTTHRCVTTDCRKSSRHGFHFLPIASTNLFSTKPLCSGHKKRPKIMPTTSSCSFTSLPLNLQH